MIWQVERGSQRSFLLGTAHFFPHSFRSSLKRLFQGVCHVVFEGPLDEESMARVVHEGTAVTPSHLFDLLEPRTVTKIADMLGPSCRGKHSMLLLNLLTTGTETPTYRLVEGMKPWLAFFTIYSRYVEKRGWKYSVDREAYLLALDMGKQVAFLETIEEQIAVLEGLSMPRILDFLERIDHWDAYTTRFVEWYLNGDVESIKSNVFGFPTRHPSVIDRRDEIFYERMTPYLTEGAAVFCVGAPHITKLLMILSGAGYRVRHLSNVCEG